MMLCFQPIGSETNYDTAEPRPAGLCVHKLMDTLTGPRRQVEDAPPRRTDSGWHAKPPDQHMMSAKSIYMYDVLYERVIQRRWSVLLHMIDGGSLLPVNIGLCERCLWNQMEAIWLFGRAADQDRGLTGLSPRKV